MNQSACKSRQPSQRPSGEFLLLIVVAVLVTTIALLHLAVERERAAGPLDLQLVSSMGLDAPAAGTRGDSKGQ
ncbi:uncharacterized protein (UPF0333 family) [Variovorax sp. W1I1]|uniref:hypothetical protein n=1 Tax=Variovorax sp. W1I1 TaxID=3042309 RepID=UPI002780CB15|nr:hypothetical protein [Variovorax sp. W1I1]MDQ0607365.1 uncharacterized protein (UPF0333 family) [Variovorax sp. W1I1]